MATNDHAHVRCTFIGCAGWSIPRDAAGRFPETGSHLERYSEQFRAVEINSSFYRPHRRQTYEKWADAVPESFRFAVKVPKAITHELRLRDAGETLSSFLGEVGGLGSKLGPLLVQLPPSLQYDEAIARKFFVMFRDKFQGLIALEPRHASWFTEEADEILSRFKIAQVAADPATVAGAAHCGGWGGLRYFRLHGTPTVYYSAYSSGFLQTISTQIGAGASEGAQTWCIFDNTAQGAAIVNALELRDLIRGKRWDT